MADRPIVAIDLIVERDGAVLLGELSDLWRDEGKYRWGLPGREIAHGEDLASCARRNLLDETRLRVTSARFVTLNSNFGLGNHYVTVGVLVEADGEPMVTRPEDWLRWEWFPVGEMPVHLFPAAQKTLDAYLNGIICPELSL